MGLLDVLKKMLTDVLKPKATTPKSNTKAKSNTLTARVAGTSYRDTKSILTLGKPNPDYQLDKRALIKKFPDGHTVYEYIFPEYEASLEFEPANEHDPNAIKVLIEGIHVGYIKKGSCSRIRNLINQNKILSITATIYGGNCKDLICNCGIGEKPTSADYEFEKSKGDIGISLELKLSE